MCENPFPAEWDDSEVARLTYEALTLTAIATGDKDTLDKITERAQTSAAAREGHRAAVLTADRILRKQS